MQNGPEYLLIAHWVMKESRWVSASEIADNFNISKCKAINTVSYIISHVSEISCATKTTPNKIEGRGRQTQRLIKITNIDPKIHMRLKNKELKSKNYIEDVKNVIPISTSKPTLQQRWMIITSKRMRRYF